MDHVNSYECICPSNYKGFHCDQGKAKSINQNIYHLLVLLYFNIKTCDGRASWIYIKHNSISLRYHVRGHALLARSLRAVCDSVIVDRMHKHEHPVIRLALPSGVPSDVAGHEPQFVLSHSVSFVFPNVIPTNCVMLSLHCILVSLPPCAFALDHALDQAGLFAGIHGLSYTQNDIFLCSFFHIVNILIKRT